MDSQDAQLAELLQELEKQIAKKEFSLPALPDSAQRVSHAINDSNVNNDQVARIITTDPVLSGRLIQVANSAIFQGLNRIDDVKRAISRLGLTCVRNLVVSLSVNQIFNVKGQPFVKNQLEKIWQNNMKIAAICEVLARGHWQLEPSQALIAGLLHNIGTIPILNFLAQEKYAARAEELIKVAFVKFEPELSQSILENWNIGEEISSIPITIQKLNAEVSGPVSYADLVQVARLHTFRGSSHPLAKVSWANIPAFKRMDLTPEASIEAIRLAKKEIDDTVRLLNGK